MDVNTLGDWHGYAEWNRITIQDIHPFQHFDANGECNGFPIVNRKSYGYCFWNWKWHGYANKLMDGHANTFHDSVTNRDGNRNLDCHTDTNGNTDSIRDGIQDRFGHCLADLYTQSDHNRYCVQDGNNYGNANLQQNCFCNAI